MNKKISTRVGIVTGLSILAFILFLRNIAIVENSPIIFLQFVILLVGIVVSCILLYRFYADIQFVDAFTHCIKTAITALLIVMIGYSILFLIFSKNQPFSSYTLMLMKTIFAYSLSGLFSAFFTSLIFNTFTKNKA
jgi:hypothetical protein